MTRFTMKSDVTWGDGDNPRSVAVHTENIKGFEAWIAKAGDAVADSRKLLLKALDAVAYKPSPEVIALAHRYFLTGANAISDGDTTAIIAVLRLTANGLTNATMAIKVGQSEQSDGQPAHGYVSGSQWFGGVNPNPKDHHNTVNNMSDGISRERGAIHVTGPRLMTGRLGVQSMIHEASHKYAGTSDYCYFHEDGVRPNGTFNNKAMALTNADSFAWFALEAGRGSAWSSVWDFKNNLAW